MTDPWAPRDSSSRDARASDLYRPKAREHDDRYRRDARDSYRRDGCERSPPRRDDPGVDCYRDRERGLSRRDENAREHERRGEPHRSDRPRARHHEGEFRSGRDDRDRRDGRDHHSSRHNDRRDHSPARRDLPYRERSPRPRTPPMDSRASASRSHTSRFEAPRARDRVIRGERGGRRKRGGKKVKERQEKARIAAEKRAAGADVGDAAMAGETGAAGEAEEAVDAAVEGTDDADATAPAEEKVNTETVGGTQGEVHDAALDDETLDVPLEEMDDSRRDQD